MQPHMIPLLISPRLFYILAGVEKLEHVAYAQSPSGSRYHVTSSSRTTLTAVTMRMMLHTQALCSVNVHIPSAILIPDLQCRGCKYSAHAKFLSHIHLQLPNTDDG